MRNAWIWGLVAVAALAAGRAEAAFIIEVDTDGQDDGTVTYSPNFAFGGDTTTASSSVAGTAPGLTGGDSIFGGDGVSEPDTYLYTYTPGTDADNATFSPGADLGEGNVATGLLGGSTGIYNVYATWPNTANVSGGPTTFTLSDADGDLFGAEVDQNNRNDAWVLLGSALLDAGTTYTLAQTAGSNTFVSMRSAGVLFEFVAVPEPSSLALLALGGLGLTMARRRSRRAG